MSLRNFWIEVEIDGRKHKLVGGPRTKNGGFTLSVRQREKGSSVHVLRVHGIPVGEKLTLEVEDPRDGNRSLHRIQTER